MSIFNTLANKVNKDAHFGSNTEFGRAFNESNNVQVTSASVAEKAILDLDLIVEKWIAYMWDNTSKGKQSSKQQPLEFEDLDIIVNWNKVEINQDEAVFKDAHGVKNKKLNQQTLFRTYFTNRTDKEQEYSFKTERVTRQTCSFSFIKGFSREKEGAISFKLPYDVVELAAGLRSEQSVECGKDKSNEEEITWGVDSTVKVAPFTKTTAELVINELELDRDFSVSTYLKGRISVIVNSKRDNNAFLKSFSSDICQVFELAERKNWINKTNKIEIIRGSGDPMTRIEFAGKCNIRLGIEQHINLKDEPL